MREGMIVAVLDFVITLIFEFGANYIMVSGFESKKNRSKLKDALRFWVISFPLLFVKFWFNDISILRNGCLAAIILLCIVYLHVTMQGNLWKKVLFIALQEVAVFSAEMIIVITLWDNLSGSTVGDVYNPSVAIMNILLALGIDILYWLVLVVWRRFMMKKTTNVVYTLLFVFFPLSQIFLFYANSNEIMVMGMEHNIFLVIGVVISFLADAALMVTMINQQQMDDMRIHLMEMQNARLIEQKHYEEIENRREELAKIRHDLNEQFILMSELNERGDKDKVAEMLTRLTEYVASTREYQYCADPVVNAIMAENEKFCREKQITLTYELEIYRPLQIDPVTICSIFTNVLRNAITATDQTAGERKIMIRASVRGDYLHLIEENPYDAESHRRERKGYGLDILRSLTENLNGQMEIRRKDGGFRLELSVENRQTEQAV